MFGGFLTLSYQLIQSEVVDESGIKVGTVMMIQMMMDIAYGNEPEEGYYYNEMRNRGHP